MKVSEDKKIFFNLTDPEACENVVDAISYKPILTPYQTGHGHSVFSQSYKYILALH